MNSESQESYLILTQLLPMYPYEIHEGHLLRAIRPSKEMLRGTGCNTYHGRMALTYIDESYQLSHEQLYRDIVMFHSFVSDNPETYEYAEWLEHTRSYRTYANSELEFIDDLMVSDARHPIDDGVLYRCCGVDFGQYPLKIFDDPKDVATGEEKGAIVVPEKWTPLREGSSFRLDNQSLYEKIDYRVAFKTFRSLSDVDVDLRNQIDLYVFTGSLWHIAQIYRNDYLTAAFYIAVLESIAGQPEACSNKIECPVCKEKIDHRVTSLEKHFINTYGKWFKDLREIRHKFFHEVAHFDFVEALNGIYDKRRPGLKLHRQPLSEDDMRKEKQYFQINDDTEKLGKIVRKRLIELFLKHYYNAIESN